VAKIGGDQKILRRVKMPPGIQSEEIGRVTCARLSTRADRNRQRNCCRTNRIDPIGRRTACAGNACDFSSSLLPLHLLSPSSQLPPSPAGLRFSSSEKLVSFSSLFSCSPPAMLAAANTCAVFSAAKIAGGCPFLTQPFLFCTLGFIECGAFYFCCLGAIYSR
jgi:hypothetical protein